jgi:hypothetical protein
MISRRLWSPLLSVSLGVAYGLSIRFLFGLFDQGASVVSISFLVLVPIVIGALVVYFDATISVRPVLRAVMLPWLSIVIFLGTTVALLLEGSICVVIAAPAFLALSSIGGLIGRWAKLIRKPGTTVMSSVVMLPLLVAPLEGQSVSKPETYTVSRSVRIAARPETIWSNILEVPPISDHELPFSFNDLLGIPRPIEAHMRYLNGQAVRDTKWEHGISFREVIVKSEPNKTVEWEFDFPPGSIPVGALDNHVSLAGKYFHLESGGYTLQKVSEFSTNLTLRTNYKISMRPLVYGRLWSYVVLTEFHERILNIVRNRAERVTAN